MARTFALVALLALVAPAGAGHSIRNQRAFLAADMQPEVVARTLMNVEQEWKSEAAIFVECSGAGEGGDAVVDCNEAPKAFAKSCSTVVSAVVRGSNGDKDVVKEYMEDVCGQNSISGWQKDGCVDLAAAVEKIMTADNYENRNNLDASQPCLSFWSRFLETEKARAAKEEAERKEAEKKAAEEAAKQAAEAAKKAKEEAEQAAKAEAEHKKAEEAERKKKEAEEAASRVAEAAKRLAEKKAEAEAVAKAAQEKMEEANRVEKEHRDLLAKANQAKIPAPKAANTSAAPLATPSPVQATATAQPKNSTAPVTAQGAAKTVNATSK
mmetsp:Transcript_29073/g.50838  ORF Transcript_29073/g.50838 Transcript_29073/m.50838 type:complete len:325 (+) Transcript_29073:55-1029(+)